MVSIVLTAAADPQQRCQQRSVWLEVDFMVGSSPVGPKQQGSEHSLAEVLACSLSQPHHLFTKHCLYCGHPVATGNRPVLDTEGEIKHTAAVYLCLTGLWGSVVVQEQRQ